MNPNDTTNRTTQTTPPRTIRPAAAVIAGLTLSAVVLAGCAGQASALGDDLSSVTDATPVTFSYTGTVQQYTVPDGVASLTIVGIGGSGGTSRTVNANVAAAAKVSGSLAVQPGQQLLVSVGQSGGSASSHDTDPPGGWGGLGANGGNGNAASDTLRTGGAGGGATTIQLADADGTNPQTVLVAGGGGGAGGPSGDSVEIGSGGGAGCTGGSTPWWPGSNGQDGSQILGGKGGTAGGESGMAGGRGQGGSGLGGNGGGGGGGVNGGSPGSGASGTSAAGGGGAGSSATFGMTNTSVNCSLNGGGEPASSDGNVVVTPNPS